MTDDPIDGAVTTAERIRAYLDTVTKMVIDADSAYSILRTIGEHAEWLNANNHGDLGAFLQRTMADRFHLAVARLFEPPKKQYENVGLPRIIRLIAANGDAVPSADTQRLCESLASMETALFGQTSSDVSLASQNVAERLSRALPTATELAGSDLAKAFDSVKALRDKRIAHHDAVPSSQIPSTTWANVQRLLSVAKEMIAAIGWGYFNIAHTDDNGRFMLTSDAERAGRSLERLLKRAAEGTAARATERQRGLEPM